MIMVVLNQLLSRQCSTEAEWFDCGKLFVSYKSGSVTMGMAIAPGLLLQLVLKEVPVGLRLRKV